VTFDVATLETLRRQHPAWRLLAADSAPLVASFLNDVFVQPNVRAMPQSQLVQALDDTLYALREQRGDAAWPRPAQEYLNDWCGNDRGWLRKFYPAGSDEPHFELTPATEKAIAWLAGLAARGFVGTESRLLTLVSLLQQMSAGSETDPQVRLAELQRQRAELDEEIERVREGRFAPLGDTALKDRFQQFAALARELLADFREVEHNFRALDRRVRERIALWDGGKGALLQEIMGERDVIAESDQGRSFRAFWDFLMSQSRQEELTALLDRVLALPPVADLKPDARLRRVHYDWLEAGEHAQRTVALLSQQLRRFLDDQALLENRHIMALLRGIDALALAVRERSPAGAFMDIEETAASIELPMERPLHSGRARLAVSALVADAGDENLDVDSLYSQFVVDKDRLAQRLRQSLQDRSQITLAELLRQNPLDQGLAELVAWLELAAQQDAAVDEDGEPDLAAWNAADGSRREVRMPRVIFTR
jgi:flagellar motility protein MotE (MotC chaperone)